MMSKNGFRFYSWLTLFVFFGSVILMGWAAFDYFSAGNGIGSLARLLSSFMAGIFIMLWYFLYQRNDAEKDYSLLFFSMAMLVWGFPDGQRLWAASPEFPNKQVLIFFFSQFRAQLNSLLLLMAYRYLHNKFPERMVAWGKNRAPRILAITPRQYTKAIGALGLAVLIAVILASFNQDNATQKPPVWYAIFDFGFNCALMLLLLFPFFLSPYRRFGSEPTPHASFISNKLLGIGLGIFSVLGLLIIIVFYVLYYIFEDPGSVLKLPPIYQFLFLITTSILAFSWVYEKMIRDGKSREQQLKALNEQLAKTQKSAENTKDDAFHALGNSIRRMRNEFLENAYSEDQDNKLQNYYKEAAINLDIFLGLFEDREYYSLKHRPLKKYLVWFLSQIKQGFKFKHFDFEERLLIPESYEADSSQVQKVAKILHELCINALKKGGQHVEVDISVHDNIMHISVRDQGGIFPLKSSQQGLNIIRKYLEELDPAQYIFERQNNQTIIQFNMNSLLGAFSS